MFKTKCFRDIPHLFTIKVNLCPPRARNRNGPTSSPDFRFWLADSTLRITEACLELGHLPQMNPSYKTWLESLKRRELGHPKITKQIAGLFLSLLTNACLLNKCLYVYRIWLNTHFIYKLVIVRLSGSIHCHVPLRLAATDTRKILTVPNDRYELNCILEKFTC